MEITSAEQIKWIIIWSINLEVLLYSMKWQLIFWSVTTENACSEKKNGFEFVPRNKINCYAYFIRVLIVALLKKYTKRQSKSIVNVSGKCAQNRKKLSQLITNDVNKTITKCLWQRRQRASSGNHLRYWLFSRWKRSSAERKRRRP